MAIPLKRFPKRRVVDYDQFRPEINSGDLLLCSGSSMFSRAIQLGTGSVWSHVGFVMRLDAIDRVMVLESVESLGVRTVPLRKYLEDYDSRGNPYPGGIVLARHSAFSAITAGNKRKLRQFGQFAADLFGYPYDKDEIAKITLRVMASVVSFTKKDGRALKRDREYICSEYVWECYRRLGIRIASNSKGFIAPVDFAKAKEVTLLAVLKAK